MTINISKSIPVNITPQDYDVIILTENRSCNLTYEILSVNVAGTSALANVSISINGVSNQSPLSYPFTYDPNAGDVFAQAEKYILSLDEFTGATSQ